MREIEENVKKILISKLEEMAKIKIDCCDPGEYPEICSIMNKIARTLLNK